MTEKPRTYRKKARIGFLNFIRGRRRTRQEIRRAARIQLQYLRRNLRIINELLGTVSPFSISARQRKDLIVINEVFRQQRELYKKKTHSIPGKILSISQPHVRPIARGKACAAFEFGTKVSASVTEHGMMYVDRLQWESYNEGEDLKMQVERYRQRFGRYPESLHADKIYRTRENRNYCESKNIRLSGPHLGRPIIRTEENEKRLRLMKRLERKDEGIRQKVEGKFGTVKRKFGLANVYEKLRVTSETTILICVLLSNCDKILRDLFLRFSLYLGLWSGKINNCYVI